MIKNEKQYKITRAWLRRFETGVDKLNALPTSAEQPWLRQAQRGSLKAQIQQLRAEIDEYEALKSGKVKVPLPSEEAIAELPTLLIKRRIANGWTLKRLAEKVGLHWQQIQRYEQTDYASATVRVLLKVAAVLTECDECRPNVATRPRAASPQAGKAATRQAGQRRRRA